MNVNGTLHTGFSVRDLDEAENWYRRSLDLSEKHDRLGKSNCHNQLGTVSPTLHNLLCVVK